MILRAAALQPPDYAGYIDRSWDQRRVELGNSLTSFCFTWPALVAFRGRFFVVLGNQTRFSGDVLLCRFLC